MRHSEFRGFGQSMLYILLLELPLVGSKCLPQLLGLNRQVLEGRIIQFSSALGSPATYVLPWHRQGCACLPGLGPEEHLLGLLLGRKRHELLQKRKRGKKKNKDRSLSRPADATLESTNYVVVFSAGFSFAHCSPRIKIPKSPSYSSPWRRSIFDSFLKTLITMENIDTRQHFLQHCN